MIIKAFLKRDKQGVLYTDKKLKDEAKRVSEFGIDDIRQYCSENDYAGVIRKNGNISLTTFDFYQQTLQ